METTTDLLAGMETPAEEIRDFDAVVRCHWLRVFRFVLVSVRDRDAAETLTQDCFLKAYKARFQFRGESSVKTWLMQIAVNVVRDFVRSRRLQFWRRASESADVDICDWLPDRDLSPEEKTLLKERVTSVWNVTVALPERQRTIFLLRFVEDLSLLEIAAATGLTEGAVKVHLFRAVHAVRKRLGSMK
jgi:RNA polymerase sigma-70 factor (ECF subfamily)